jgi:hypothetical protein
VLDNPPRGIVGGSKHLCVTSAHEPDCFVDIKRPAESVAISRAVARRRGAILY